MFQNEEKVKVPASWKKYANQVVNRLHASGELKKQIRNDLYESMYERLGVGDSREPASVMGSAESMARDFAEHFQVHLAQGFADEYESEIRIWGLPLAHIVRGRGKTKVAKGIFAVGPIAVGVFAFGGVSMGVVSLGGVSFGLFALGGMALALLVGLGGFAVAGALAVGALAIAWDVAIGAMAVSNHVAVGVKAFAHVAGYFGEAAMEGATYSYQLPREAYDMLLRIATEFSNAGGHIRFLMWLFMMM